MQTVDEALNQREFDAARRAWLASDMIKQQQPGESKSPSHSIIDNNSSTRKNIIAAKVIQRTDLLQAENDKMDARLAALRMKMTAEKAKHEAKKQGRMREKVRGSEVASITRIQTRSSPAPTSSTTASGLAATIKLAPAISIAPTASSSTRNYSHISSRIDRDNTFLTVLAQTKREAAHNAKVEAERKKKEEEKREAEEKRMAYLKAHGHTLITYAEPEPPPKWTIQHDAAFDQEQPQQSDLHQQSHPSSTSQSTAARTDYTQFNLLPAHSSSFSSATSSNLFDGEYDEASNAAAFAAARNEFLASLNPREPMSIQHEHELDEEVPVDDEEEYPSMNLLDAGDYDEAKNAADFAAARQEFLDSLKSDATSSSRHVAPTSVSVTASSHPHPDSTAFLSSIPHHQHDETGGVQVEDRFFSAAPGSLLDGPAFNEAESTQDFARAREEWLAASTASTSSATSNHALSSLPRPASSASSSSKVVCYHCYKLFYADQSPTAPTDSSSSSSTSASRRFCTPVCAAASAATESISCATCTRKVKRCDARLDTHNRYRCVACSNTATSTDTPPDTAASVPEPSLLSLLSGGDEFLSSLASAARYTHE